MASVRPIGRSLAHYAVDEPAVTWQQQPLFVDDTDDPLWTSSSSALDDRLLAVRHIKPFDRYVTFGV